MRQRVAMALAALFLTVMASSSLAGEVFAPPRWGVAATLPDGWTAEKPEAFSVLVFPPPDTLAAGAVLLSLRNLHRPDNVAPGDGPAALADRLTEEIRTQAKAGTVRKEAPFRWKIPRGVLIGRQIVADFTRDGLALRQWTVFLPSPYGPVVHMWQYIAPEAAFTEHLSAARAMLDSLTPREVDTETPEDSQTSH